MKNEQHTSIIVGKIFKGLVAIAVIGILALFVFVFIPGIKGPEKTPPEVSEEKVSSESEAESQKDIKKTYAIVPKLKGLSETEAESKIEALKLVLNIKNSLTLEPSLVGKVIEEPNPSPGTSLLPGDTVRIKVGIKGVKVPSLEGMLLEKAQAKADSFKLGLDRKEEKQLETVDETIPIIVKKQAPLPNSIVAENSPITVYITPSLVSIPKLIKDSISQLNRTVEKNENKLWSLESQISGEWAFPKGIVIVVLFVVVFAVIGAGVMIARKLHRSKESKDEAGPKQLLEKLEEVENSFNRRIDELEKQIKPPSVSDYERVLSSCKDSIESLEKKLPLLTQLDSIGKGGGASIDDIKWAMQGIIADKLAEGLRQELKREMGQLPKRVAEEIMKGVSTLFNRDSIETLFPKGSVVGKETKPVEKNTEKDIVDLYNRAISGDERDYYRDEFKRKFEPIKVSHSGEIGALIISEDQAGRFYLISKGKDFLVPVFDAAIENCVDCFTCVRSVPVFYPVEVVDLLMKPALCTNISDGKWRLAEKGEIVVKRKY
jgi:Na+-transporting methylmalonyl-CoA/oxaloacetate decarboxylase gamma subunit